MQRRAVIVTGRAERISAPRCCESILGMRHGRHKSGARPFEQSDSSDLRKQISVQEAFSVLEQL
jgi:hypothetical protein